MVPVVVVGHHTRLLAGLPDLGLTLADAAHHVVGQGVHLGRHAVRLVQHLDLAFEAQEAVHVGSCPGVDSLVVVACQKRTLGAQCQLRNQPPLQAREVLCLIDDENVQPWQTVRLQ